MKAFVAGSTGETGRRIVRKLIDRQIPVRALVRTIGSAQAILPAEAEIFSGDLSQPERLRAGMEGCDVVICATGARPSLDPTGPYAVDFVGTKQLVDIAKSQGIRHFVLVSSLCTSQFFHPLNLFWLVLYWKKQAEDYLRISGLTYTIVRPGGLKNDDNPDPIRFSGADSLFEGSIPRLQVAEVCVEALFHPESHNKIVEIVTNASGTPTPEWSAAFASIA